MILIVEDDDDIRSQVAKALKAEGFKILEASNGLEAIEQLKQQTQLPSCILLDLMMPVMDGPRFIDTIQRDFPRFALIPIVIHTARGSAELILKQIPEKYERLHKPIDLEILYSTVERYEAEAG